VGLAVGAALAALDPGDRLAGVLPGGPLGRLDGAHRNSPLVLTEIPQVSGPVALPV
jgi:hypothetical protein